MSGDTPRAPLARRIARRARYETGRAAGAPRKAYLIARRRWITFLRPYWHAQELGEGRAWRGDRDAAHAVADIERQLLKTLGVDGLAVATSSGRTAFRLALRALRRAHRDRTEVVIPTYSCRGLIDPILECGLTPVFTDIGSDLNMTAADADAAVSERTLAIVVVHLGGKRDDEAAAIARLATTRGAIVIEDVCQAFGARTGGVVWGATAPMAIYSFGLGKNVMATAGGLLIARTAAAAVEAEAARLTPEPGENAVTRFHYMTDVLMRQGLRHLTDPPPPPRRALAESYGDARMSGLDAVLLARQLERLGEILDRRAAHAAALLDALGDQTALRVPGRDGANVWTKFTVAASRDVDDATRIRRHLATDGVETEPMYTPLHLREITPSAHAAYPMSEWMEGRAFNLPVHPGLSPEQIAHVAGAVRRAAAHSQR